MPAERLTTRPSATLPVAYRRVLAAADFNSAALALDIGAFVRKARAAHGCYEGLPTGLGLVARGSRWSAITGETSRAAQPGDDDREDAELLVWLLLTGQLTMVTGPPMWVQAAALAMTRAARGSDERSRPG
jgi:hypothetical protein